MTWLSVLDLLAEDANVRCDGIVAIRAPTAVKLEEEEEEDGRDVA